MSNHLKLSLQELLSSDCLSTCTLSLSKSNNNNIPVIEDLQCLNASKLSLLLVQTAVKWFHNKGRYCNNDNDDDDDDGVGSIDFTSLRLDNFIVKLTCEEIDSVAVGDDDDDAVVNENNSNTVPLDYNAEPKFDDADLTMLSQSLFEEEDPAIENGVETREEDSVIIVKRGEMSSVSYDRDTFDIINAANRLEKAVWTLLGMEIHINDKRKEVGRDDCMSKLLRFVAKLICKIFTPKSTYNQELESVFNKLLTLNDQRPRISNGDGLSSGHNNDRCKQRRKGQSLFSELVDCGDYPISVCRLLSDMIGTDDGGMTDSSYNTSLEEVMDDLEQMSSHPSLFLDNPRDGFFSSPLHFDRGCYGRENEVDTILGVAIRLEESRVSQRSSSGCIEAILISGKAGSGKSYLVQNVVTCLDSRGWITLQSKFDIGLEHESRDAVTCIFDKLVSTLIKMRDGDNDEDIQYSQKAVVSISDALDKDGLASLATLIPRIKELVNDSDGITNEENSDSGGGAESETSHSYWRLVLLLSSLLGAVLSLDRQVLICYDDLQWCDSSMFSLIYDVITSISSLPQAKHRLLFIGISRDTELQFKTQLEILEQKKKLNVTTLPLASLTKSDVTNMISAEMRLPRRLIICSSEIIFKKTAGHCIFIHQLLNSLVNSIIVYSPTKHRYDWDIERLKVLPTSDNVADFIVSNLSTLPEEDMQILRILSCFDAKVHHSIIKLIEDCSGIVGAIDIMCSVPRLVDDGILEEGNEAVSFSHDLIHQQVYSKIDIDHRRQMHLDIGLYLGSKTTLDHEMEPHIEANEGSLATTATHHINQASKDHIREPSQRVRFACWNYKVAFGATRCYNYVSALHYYQNGIELLDDDLAWRNNTQDISYNLYKGTATTLLALGSTEKAQACANTMIANLPLDKSISAHNILIMSNSRSGAVKESVALTIALLRKLGGFDIPSVPKLYLSYLAAGASSLMPSSTSSPLFPTIVKQRMAKTDELILKYNVEERIDEIAAGKIDDSNRDILNILNCVSYAGLRSRSPYLALIVMSTIEYSLKKSCLSGESALAFCLYGYMKLWYEGDWKAGEFWGNLANKILDKSNQPFTREFNKFNIMIAWFIGKESQPNLTLHLGTQTLIVQLLLVWNKPLQQSADDLFKIYEQGMKYGNVESASMSLCNYFRWTFIAGEMPLPILKEKQEKVLAQLARYNIDAVKLSVLFLVNINILMGEPCDAYSVFDDKINNEEALLEDALQSKNINVAMGVYIRRFFVSAWFGNMKEALEAIQQAMSYVPSKWTGPIILHIFIAWTRGIVAFHLYRQGDGDAMFNEGLEMFEKLKKWKVNAPALVTKNMTLLLHAELYASECNVDKATETFKEAIESVVTYSAKGYAYERFGQYLSEICEVDQAKEMYKNACNCYKKWGANEKVKQLMKNHDLEVSQVGEISTKRDRDEGRKDDNKC